MSRYPTRLEQYIPGFSLWWIGMVRDYWWYVDDPAADSPRFIRRVRSSFAKRRSGFTGMPAGTCTPIHRPNSNFRSTRTPMAVLADVITGTPARDLMLRTLTAPGLAQGKVEVRLEPQGAGMGANITLPPGTPGEFVWRGTRRELAPGVNRFSL